MNSRDPDRVRQMFDRIARHYDRTNTVLSGGLDSMWRRRAVRATRLEPGAFALDIACGSGVLAARLQRMVGRSGRAVGLDFSGEMLRVASRQHPGLEFVRADALQLPFEDQRFDAATMAFGLRNLSEPERGLREMRRVVKAGGALVLLEFLRPPPTLFGQAYRLYLNVALPRLGGLIGGDRRAYDYLGTTVGNYLTAAELRAFAVEAQWSDVRVETLTGQTVALMSGRR